MGLVGRMYVKKGGWGGVFTAGSGFIDVNETLPGIAVYGSVEKRDKKTIGRMDIKLRHPQ